MTRSSQLQPFRLMLELIEAESNVRNVLVSSPVPICGKDVVQRRTQNGRTQDASLEHRTPASIEVAGCVLGTDDDTIVLGLSLVTGGPPEYERRIGRTWFGSLCPCSQTLGYHRPELAQLSPKDSADLFPRRHMAVTVDAAGSGAQVGV